MNNSDIVKLEELLRKTSQKNYIITSKTQYSCYSDATRLQKYDVHCLKKSNGPRNITSDQFSQKIKPIIIQTAKLSLQEARIKISQVLKCYFPNNYVNVIIWHAGQIEHTTCKQNTAYATFKVSENIDYGHDVLVILNQFTSNLL